MIQKFLSFIVKHCPIHHLFLFFSSVMREVQLQCESVLLLMTEVCIICFRRTQENGCPGCVSLYSCSRCNNGRLCPMCKNVWGESSYGAWNTRYMYQGETMYIRDENSILTGFDSWVSSLQKFLLTSLNI